MVAPPREVALVRLQCDHPAGYRRRMGGPHHTYAVWQDVLLRALGVISEVQVCATTPADWFDIHTVVDEQGNVDWRRTGI